MTSEAARRRFTEQILPHLDDAYTLARWLTGNPTDAEDVVQDACISEAFISDLHEDWKEHGIQAIEEVRERRPADYLRIVAMIVLKCEDYANGLAAGIHDEAIAELIEVSSVSTYETDSAG
jgi:Sigma-70 region 2